MILTVIVNRHVCWWLLINIYIFYSSLIKLFWSKEGKLCIGCLLFPWDLFCEFIGFTVKNDWIFNKMDLRAKDMASVASIKQTIQWIRTTLSICVMSIFKMSRVRKVSWKIGLKLRHARIKLRPAEWCSQPCNVTVSSSMMCIQEMSICRCRVKVNMDQEEKIINKDRS